MAEALRQLVGEECYRQDEVLPPGYCTGKPWAVGRGLPGGIWGLRVGGYLGQNELWLLCHCLPCATASGTKLPEPSHCRKGGFPCAYVCWHGVPEPLSHQLLFSVLSRTDFLLWINRSGTVLPLSRVPAASRAPPATSLVTMSLRSSVLALTSDLQDFAPFAAEAPSSPPGPRESSRAGRFVPALCPAPGGPCFQPPSDYYCGLSKEPSLGSPGSSTLSSPSECLSAPPPGTPDCSPRTSAASLFQFPIGKILEEEEEAAGCPGQEHSCFQGEQAQEQAEERSPPASEDGPPPSPCRPSPKRGPGEGPKGTEEIQRYEQGHVPGLCPWSLLVGQPPWHCLGLLPAETLSPGPFLPNARGHPQTRVPSALECWVQLSLLLAGSGVIGVLLLSCHSAGEQGPGAG